ncbi:MAG TPA: 4a-hydroxytetrahydrobiopterin dehydratase [Fimbriimonadaceae bacterium]|nr:4a-hydroxytetrahydrobiopterin dehydratase [Fimbriimonadaceae bacterium]
MGELSYDRLAPEEAAERAKALDGWAIIDGALTKEFEFKTYADGVLFAVACARSAEALNHHPDLLVGYKKVKVSYVTHDAGGGLTSYDFEAARRVQQLA